MDTNICHASVPSARLAIEFLDAVLSRLFPVTQGVISVGGTHGWHKHGWRKLRRRFNKLLRPVVPDKERRAEIVEVFFAALPKLYAGFLDDAELFRRSDPAAQSTQEVVLCYPGFYAIAVYRLAHELYVLGVPILPRMLSEHAHSRTGIDINPGATIGRNFFIDHGTGIVIGETAVIGDGVKVYQGVTLGATFVDKDMQGTKRHPTIEDGVILYANCTILGGDTVVGAGSVVGGNVWLTESVPAGTTVFHKENVVIKGKN